MHPFANRVSFLILFLLPAITWSAENVSAPEPSVVFLNVDPSEQTPEENSIIQLYEYIASAPPRIAIQWPGKIPEKTVCEINSVPCSFEKPIELKLGAGQRRNFEFALRYGEASHPKKTTIKLQIADIVVQGSSRLKSNILMTVNGALLMLSPEGEILFFRKNIKESIDFKGFKADGKIFYSYLQSERGFLGIHQEGIRVILDDHFNVVEKLPWPAVDGHDFVSLGRNHHIRTEYSIADLPAKQCILEQQVIETVDGKEVAKFSVKDYLVAHHADWSMTNRITYKGRTCYQALHLNSIQVIDPSHWLLGLGTSVVMFNKVTGLVDWILGDPFDEFFYQKHDFAMKSLGLTHTPIWNPETGILALFANWTFSKDDGARLNFFKLNPLKRTIEKIDTIPLGISAYHSGGIEMFGEHISIAPGAVADQSQIRTFDYAEMDRGETTPHFTIKFKVSPPVYIYRAYRFGVMTNALALESR
jgi:hypothetical protein